MRIDVIVPTFNRSAMVKATVRSILGARLPSGMTLHLTVVDNNSTDDTPSVLAALAGESGGRLSHLHEARQGRSFALNAGIGETTGDIIGFIDDDEEIHPAWFEVIDAQFRRGDIEFLGGPYHPVWQSAMPEWLPRAYYGAVGSITEPTVEMAYGVDFPGQLMGGNAVMTRAALMRAGFYNTAPCMSRRGNALFVGEDRDMYHRLLNSGARGRYSPELIIYHHIPDSRVTITYLRRWAYFHGMSAVYMERFGIKPRSGPTFFGVPRWVFAKALKGLPRIAAQPFAGRSTGSAAAELALMELLGHVAGRVRFRSLVEGSVRTVSTS